MLTSDIPEIICRYLPVSLCYVDNIVRLEAILCTDLKMVIGVWQKLFLGLSTSMFRMSA